MTKSKVVIEYQATLELKACGSCGTSNDNVRVSGGGMSFWQVHCFKCGLSSGLRKTRDEAVEHFNSVSVNPALYAALKAVETALFAHASAGATSEKGELTPVDNELHPWIPGAEAWAVVETVRAALALTEEGLGK